MRSGWWAYPPNRRRAGLTGGAGTVIAAISAGLIAGLSQHPGSTTLQTSHRVTDAALYNPSTTVDSSNTEHPAAAPVAPARTAGQDTPAASALNATTVPTPPLAQAPAASAENSSTRSDEQATTQPVAAPTTTAPAIPQPASGDSTGFRPYVHNGPTGSATQTTSGPAGTTTITTSPSRRADHRATAPHTQAAAISADRTGDGKRGKPTSTDTDSHSTDHDAQERSDTTTSGISGVTPSSSSVSGTASSGTTGYPTQPTDASAAGQASNSSDAQTPSRVTQALPPGFSPTAPRQTLTTWPAPSPLSSASPSSRSPSIPASQSAPPGTVADSTTLPASSASQPGTTPSSTPAGMTQTRPAQTGSGQSGALSGPVPISNTTLVPVACPATVANATCYQPAPAANPAVPGPSTSPTGATGLPPAGVGSTDGPGAGAGVPTISAMPGTEAAPAALPDPRSTQVAASAPSSGDCRASGNHIDAGVRAQNWGDLSQLIMDRIQDCIDRGMSSGGGSGWNTTTSSGIKKSHSSASTSGSDSPSASSQKQRHKN